MTLAFDFRFQNHISQFYITALMMQLTLVDQEAHRCKQSTSEFNNAHVGDYDETEFKHKE